MEQKNFQERLMKLAEAQKKEKYELHQQIMKLQKKHADLELLESEIEQMRGTLEITRPFTEAGDMRAMEKMESLEEILKEKEDYLEDLECLNQALLVKERESNDEVQSARKELIKLLRAMHIPKASIGIKRMGALDYNPFVSAGKRKYPDDVAGEKAMEFSSLVEGKLRDSSWYPFKFTVVGAGRKEAIDEEDDFIKAIKNEWGIEAYDAVVTALTEMNDYDPSGRSSVDELWNFEEGRRATLAECVKFIAKLWENFIKRRT